MHALRQSMWVGAVLLLASASLASSAATVEWKCGGRTMPGYGPNEAVMILDGVVMEKGETFESADIGSLEVTCWNPDNGKFRIAPGVPAVLIWTKGFVDASSERPVEALQAAEADASRELRLLYEADGA